jgi:hypothetical protein
MSATSLQKYRVTRLEGVEDVFRIEVLMLVRHWFGKPPTEEWRPMLQHCGYDCVDTIRFGTYEKACAWIESKEKELREEAARAADKWSPMPCNIPH